MTDRVYEILSDADGNVGFFVEADSPQDAAIAALEELGYRVLLSEHEGVNRNMAAEAYVLDTLTEMYANACVAMRMALQQQAQKVLPKGTRFEAIINDKRVVVVADELYLGDGLGSVAVTKPGGRRKHHVFFSDLENAVLISKPEVEAAI